MKKKEEKMIERNDSFLCSVPTDKDAFTYLLIFNRYDHMTLFLLSKIKMAAKYFSSLQEDCICGHSREFSFENAGVITIIQVFCFLFYENVQNKK